MRDPLRVKSWSRSLCRALALLACALAMVLLAPHDNARAQGPARGVEIVPEGGNPELRIADTPFFPHAALFDYARIPHDLWDQLLDRYLELGINTVDLRIPWNWHELQAGGFDFDGHTNPRRDLRGLLKLIAAKDLHLIVRPGPAIGNLWRNAGLPDWLSDTNTVAAEKMWLEAVGRELAPYQAVQDQIAQTGSGVTPARVPSLSSSPPILFVVLEDEPAAKGSLGDWRAALEAGGMREPMIVTPLDLVKEGQTEGVPGEVPGPESATEAATGLAGRWFFEPPATIEGVPPGGAQLAPRDVANLGFLGGVLGMQDGFPPLVAELAASGHAPADDSHAVASDPANLLIATRLLLAQGVRGIEYSPLQDTLTPAGWETTTANRYLRWNAALDVGGNIQPQQRSVQRNAQMLRAWGTQLASAHLRADFGLVDVHAGGPLAPEARQSRTHALMQIERVAQLAGLTPELLDLARQPRERLLRDDVVLLPVLGADADQAQLSDEAQAALVEYVRGGGTLICFPQVPAGKLLAPLWEGERSEWNGPGGEVATVWKTGSGSAVAVAKDFYSWVEPADSFDKNRTQSEADWAITTLAQLVGLSGAQRVVERELKAEAANDALIVTQLVSDDPRPVAAGQSSACSGPRLCAAAMVSVTNLSWDQAAEEKLSIGLPTPGPGVTRADSEQLDLTVPPNDSLLLPVHAPLCTSALPTAPCRDEVVVAGAELLGAERDGKTLELTFYAPSRATVILQLRDAPGESEVDDRDLFGVWTRETHRLEVSLPRGASPDFLRVLRVHLPYVPDVPQVPDPTKRQGRYIFSVAGAVGLPLGDGVSLPSSPPLVLLDRQRIGSVLIDATRYGPAGTSPQATVNGAVHGNAFARMGADEDRLLRIKLAPYAKADAKSEVSPVPSGELPGGELQVRAGNTHYTTPLVFLPVGATGKQGPANEQGDDPVIHYKFDFARDGSDDWVLENSKLRLMLSPADGGHALALVDKSSGLSLFTSLGGLRDFVATAGVTTGPQQIPQQLIDVAFNRSYSAEWLDADQSPAVQLSYHTPEGSPSAATIEKTVRFSGSDAIETTYRFSLDPSASGRAAESLVVIASVPTTSSDDRGTRFCWVLPALGLDGAEAKPDGSGAPQPHCEVFVPGGPPLEIPAAVRRLELRTLGTAGLALEWSDGAMSIVPRNYSAELRWQLPAITPGSVSGEAAPAEVTMRYTRLPAE